MQTSDFDYHLPKSLIAQHPPEPRDAARMLVLDPVNGSLDHSWVVRLPAYLEPGDLLVLNDSRVIPARLVGKREGGGEAEVLLLRPVGEDAGWEALVKPNRKLPAGSAVIFEDSPLRVSLEGDASAGVRRVRLRGSNQPLEEVRRIGQMPTPPYIKQRLADPDRYQTIFARQEGSAAAPTAGLHFSPELLQAVRARGVSIAFVTLHVGLDTFLPVRVENPSRHPIHREWFELPAATANAVMEARRRKGRVVAVGTTCVRALESSAADGLVRPRQGWTDLLILPGYRFQVVDSLLTNFHLPRSTLLMMVSAFAGRERILNGYAEAVRKEYRFYSFGDCMLITRRAP
jgi:S-adenosylmethionine:tRNA ribosyltransferase-isomerase